MTDLADHGGWPALIGRLLDRHHLTSAQAHAAMSSILAGEATAAQLIGFVIALRAKGESAEELSGLLAAVLEAATVVPLTEQEREASIDIVGTGGDRSHSINVSTISALVVAGAGVPVCKHGARASSSRCGTADLLEALGVVVDLGPDQVAACLRSVGMAFCLAPRYHAAFRFAAPARREVGVPTVFNLLGPMANPACVRRQVIGVADGAFATRMVETLRGHGSVAAWVVHGSGLDEITTTGPSTVLALVDGEVTESTIDPRDHGIDLVPLSALAGGSPEHNAQAARRVLAGAPGPHRDIVLLNAGAALVVAGRAADLDAGIASAAAAIDQGRAAAVLDRLVAFTRAAAQTASPE